MAPKNEGFIAVQVGTVKVPYAAARKLGVLRKGGGLATWAKELIEKEAAKIGDEAARDEAKVRRARLAADKERIEKELAILEAATASEPEHGYT